METTQTARIEDTFFINDSVEVMLVTCNVCGMEALQRTDRDRARTCPRCGVLMSERLARPRARLSRIQRTILVSSLLLGLVLLTTACGRAVGLDVPETTDPEAMAIERIGDPEAEACQVEVRALAGARSLLGVLHRDLHDANPGTRTVEFEVVTGMYQGECTATPELYVNGEPAKLLRGDGETATFMASIGADEPQVLLHAFCGRCKRGVWGATVQ
jgi:hypothetical protein